MNNLGLIEECAMDAWRKYYTYAKRRKETYLFKAIKLGIRQALEKQEEVIKERKKELVKEIEFIMAHKELENVKNVVINKIKKAFEVE